MFNHKDSDNFEVMFKGKLAERQGRKAIGSTMQTHYDSLAAMWSCLLTCPFVAGFFI